MAQTGLKALVPQTKRRLSFLTSSTLTKFRHSACAGRGDCHPQHPKTALTSPHPRHCQGVAWERLFPPQNCTYGSWEWEYWPPVINCKSN